MKNERLISSAKWSIMLMVLVLFAAFFVTLFPIEWHKLLYRALFTLLYFTAIFNMEKHRKQVLFFSVLAIIMTWVAGFFEMSVIGYISKIINFTFFFYIVGALVSQVARAKTVTANVILESINGYLLIGIAFSLIVAVVCQFEPGSFNFEGDSGTGISDVTKFSNDLYYTFITMATVGYGDMLPVKPFTKSLSTLIGITGQLYIAIIIAMLVGKFASQKKD